ncbi:zinc finger, CCHC-type containing protein [Tanacetum coccineum]
MIEDDKNKNNNKNTKGKKSKNDGNNDGSNKKSKLTCWKCGKTGHFKKDCRVKKNNGGNTSSSGQGSKDPNSSQEDDTFAWWIDSGATCHACKDRCWFDTFHPVQDGSVLHMGDESSKPILSRGNVVLKFSFGKTITLVNKEAINYEMDSIMENNTWILSDLPPGCKPLGCKWIFKKKMKVDGTIDKFKARLVIQGFRQKEGNDYFGTYAHVARISTIRLLIALATTYNLVIHQMDVKTAFLYGDLEEEVTIEMYSLRMTATHEVMLAAQPQEIP